MKSSDLSGEVVFHAGFPNAGEDELSALSIDQLVFKHPASTFLWRLAEPLDELSWPTGAVVVVDRSLQPKTGDKVVAIIEEEFVVRLFKNQCLFRPDGTGEAAEDISIWGVITNLLISYR